MREQRPTSRLQWMALEAGELHVNSLRVVLLDVDGTLLDSNDAQTRSWVEALGMYGFEVSYATVRPLIGKGADKVFPELIGMQADYPIAKAISEARLTVFLEKHLAHLAPTNGARKFVEKICNSGLLPVIATSAGKELHALLRQAGVDDLIPLSTSSEDAARSKPDGDIVRAALDKAGVQSSQAVMVGDTPFDAQAAGRAGVRSIALRCGGWWSDTDHSESIELYDDPAHVLSLWERSLFGAT